jgi:hypothetical protein
MILSLYTRFNNQCVKIYLLYSCILLDQKSSGGKASLMLLQGSGYPAPGKSRLFHIQV